VQEKTDEIDSTGDLGVAKGLLLEKTGLLSTSMLVSRFLGNVVTERARLQLARQARQAFSKRLSPPRNLDVHNADQPVKLRFMQIAVLHMLTVPTCKSSINLQSM